MINNDANIDFELDLGSSTLRSNFNECRISSQWISDEHIYSKIQGLFMSGY